MHGAKLLYIASERSIRNREQVLEKKNLIIFLYLNLRRRNSGDNKGDRNGTSGGSSDRRGGDMWIGNRGGA